MVPLRKNKFREVMSLILQGYQVKQILNMEKHLPKYCTQVQVEGLYFNISILCYFIPLLHYIFHLREILNFLIHYICLTALVNIHITVLSSENHASPNVVIFNICVKQKDEVFLNLWEILRKCSYFLTIFFKLLKIKKMEK